MEIENCPGIMKYPVIDLAFYYLKKLSMHGYKCELEYLSYIFNKCWVQENFCDLSCNIFINKNSSFLNDFEKEISIAKNYGKTFKLFDLRNCNFSLSGKEKLKQMIASPNFFI